MSLESLYARQHELDDKITAQRKVLEDLQHARILVHNDLNKILDPVARLPVEISSEIFIRCLPSALDTSPLVAPMLLLQVCSHWRRIAIATPLLWSSLRLSFPRPDGFEDFLRIWVQRSYPLNFSLDLEGTMNSDLPPLMERFSEYLGRFTLRQSFASDIERCTGFFSNLTELSIAPRDGYYICRPDVILELLRRCPRLVHCTLDGMFRGKTGSAAEVVLPSLTYLKFGRGQEGTYFGNMAVLPRLRLPALETLLIVNVDTESLRTFFDRSLPPLQTLHIYHSDLGGDDFEFIRLVPTITTLTLDFDYTGVLYGLLVRLESNSPWLGGRTPFLPALEHLSVSQHSNPNAYTELIPRILTARRSQIKRFRLEWRDDLTRQVEAEILSDLRELVADGMDIYLGDTSRNQVSETSE